MVRVIIVGMGPIGAACARAVRADSQMQLVGLVDVDPSKVGRSADEIAQQPPESFNPDSDPKVSNDLHKTLSQTPADVAILTTSSQLDHIAPTLRDLLDHGVSVVSSCEEMTWPWYQHQDLARRLDDHAQSAGKAILGTGINPGFVMDSLAVMLSSVVRRVNLVRCTRWVDASLRRVPLQIKIGAGLKPEEFHTLATAGKIGHKGIAQSTALLATGLGAAVAPDSVRVTMNPVIASKPIQWANGWVEPGQVAGMRNQAAWSDGKLIVELDLCMALGLTDPYDRIEIEGPVAVQMHIPRGLPGDSATVAILINYTRTLPFARPGFHTMLDLPISGCRGRDH